jgi:type I restriction enzyme, S subunit
MIERLLDYLSDSEINHDTVEKLRSFVLDLAVRGRLVPQDPDDEPTECILRLIDSDMNRLIEQGITKKKSKLTIEKDEIPFEVPTSWQWVRLRDIANYGGKKTANPEDLPGETWLLDLEDIEKGTSKLLERVERKNRSSTSRKACFNKGNVLYAKLRPYLDKVIVADRSGVCTTEIVPVVLFSKMINPYWLRLSMKRPDFISHVNSLTYGLKMPRLGTKNAEASLHPIPPHNEQLRIIEKVDELMQLLDDLEESLNTKDLTLLELRKVALSELVKAEDNESVNEAFNRIAENANQLFSKPEDVGHLRQTILELAIRGRLVTQDNTDGTAEDICNIDKQLEEESPFEIPSGWIWARLSNLALVNGGYAFKSSNYSTEGRRVVRISDFNEDGFKDNNIVRHSYDQVLEKFTLSENDILMAMSGGTVGKSCLVKIIPEPMMVNQRVATIKITSNIVPDYMYIVIQSELIQDIINRAKNSTNDNISMGEIKDFTIPLPPFPTQQRIVQRMDDLLAICDQLGAGLMSQHTTKSILNDSLTIEALEAM